MGKSNTLFILVPFDVHEPSRHYPTRFVEIAIWTPTLARAWRRTSEHGAAQRQTQNSWAGIQHRMGMPSFESSVPTGQRPTEIQQEPQGGLGPQKARQGKKGSERYERQFKVIQVMTTCYQILFAFASRREKGIVMILPASVWWHLLSHSTPPVLWFIHTEYKRRRGFYSGRI
jgi:hypothetical protein